MRTSNRGDVPAPHVAPRAATYPNDPAEDVMFDPGSLSFVQDWVEGAGGKEETPEVEPVREDPRKSNPNRRLGVGAQPKKPKQDRVGELLTPVVSYARQHSPCNIITAVPTAAVVALHLCVRVIRSCPCVLVCGW